MSQPSKNHSKEANRFRICLFAAVVSIFGLITADIVIGVYFGIINKPVSVVKKTDGAVMDLSEQSGVGDLNSQTDIDTTMTPWTLTDCCGCPNTWIQYNRSCYLFSYDDKTFSDASDFCAQHQSHLAKVDDSSENNFLKPHSADLKDDHRWIGASDATIEGTWVWTDGSPVQFSNWNPGEPNGQRVENCGSLQKSIQFIWIDVSCADKRKPICEKTCV